MGKNLFHTPELFVQETYNEFEHRYEGFGKETYLKIKEQIPNIYYKLLFYKRIDLQTEDSYAIYSDGEKSFAIQLDPLCEVIIIWNRQRHLETGSWSNTEYDDAIGFINQYFII